jgi:hypothetical protein
VPKDGGAAALRGATGVVGRPVVDDEDRDVEAAAQVGHDRPNGGGRLEGGNDGARRVHWLVLYTGRARA